MNLKRFLPDLLVLGAALAAAAVFWTLHAAPASAPDEPPQAEPPREVTILLRVPGLEASLQENLHPNDLIGQPLDTGDGVISDCYWTICRESVWTADGEIIFAADPERRDLVITLSAQMAGEPPVFTLAGQEIRMGRGFFLSAGPLWLPTTIVGFQHEPPPTAPASS